eukprot:7384278-Prymnesium_polylepis.2
MASPPPPPPPPPPPSSSSSSSSSSAAAARAARLGGAALAFPRFDPRAPARPSPHHQGGCSSSVVVGGVVAPRRRRRCHGDGSLDGEAGAHSQPPRARGPGGPTRSRRRAHDRQRGDPLQGAPVHRRRRGGHQGQ